MTELELSERPFCAEVSAAAQEPVGATASRIEHWVLVEHAGHWPYDPLDAVPLAGRVREHLTAQLRALPHSRLLLVKRPGRTRARGVRVVYGKTPERGIAFRSVELADARELLDLDLAAALADDASAPGDRLSEPLLLVCTHGVRDRCCARYGQALCRELHRGRHGGWVWQSSHVGGDRFAGNLVCLPEALYFGRVGAAEAERVADAYVSGRVELDCYRGRSCYGFAAQAAELGVRRETGLTGFHDVHLVEQRRLDRDTWVVRFEADVAGDVYDVRVRAELRDEVYLTCRAETARRARRHVVESLEKVG